MPRRFPIFQFPNRPLIVAGLAGAVARLADPRFASLARLVSHLALLVSALEEVLSGANWFRRLLGLGGGGHALSRRRRAAYTDVAGLEPSLRACSIATGSASPDARFTATARTSSISRSL